MMKDEKPSWARAREQRIGINPDAPSVKPGFANAVRARGDDWRGYMVRNSVTTFEFESESWTSDAHDRVVNRLCMPERNAIDWFAWRAK